jgi:hypothetical protein
VIDWHRARVAGGGVDVTPSALGHRIGPSATDLSGVGTDAPGAAAPTHPTAHGQDAMAPNVSITKPE